ncbi:MAG: DegT/DnrJ/EryC1/StrS family aminotransferase [Verrucomicrobia bacterium]|nr:DegT/DnrJ/EryC1/StrS family aminotransferase [Verrucomicrobiota bacterium]
MTFKQIPFGQPILGKEEKKAVEEVLSGPILVHGPQSELFENSFAEFTGAPHAISVSSCTAGMHLIYHTLGFGPGDEVIVPSQTHVATAHAVELTGARPVFADSELKTGNVDAATIESLITARTKAIAVVHYLGVPADLEKISEIAKKYGLFLLEDCALSPGARFKGMHTGLIGDAGCFSFYPVKHLTTAEGGMIILKDESLAQKLRLLKAFGVNRSHGQRTIPGDYDVVDLGYNYRMSEVHAAIGIEQMIKLPTFLNKRRANFESLDSLLRSKNGFRILPQPVDNIRISSHYCMGLILDSELSTNRTEIMNQLRVKGIGTSIYYPHPVPHMTYYKKKYGDITCPNAESISNSIIALPVGPHLESSDMQIIADGIFSVLSVFK